MRWLVALTLTVAIVACGDDEPRQLAGYVREPAPQVDVAPLPDVAAAGEPFDLRADDDGLLIVYFGYTHCPDICPTTLADTRAALRQLDEDQQARVEVAMITVDPERDTDVLADYVRSFVDDAHALATADPALLAAVAAPFGVSYGVTGSGTEDVEVVHSTQLYAVGDDGLLRLTWAFGTTADDLAADIQQLLDAETSS